MKLTTLMEQENALEYISVNADVDYDTDIDIYSLLNDAEKLVHDRGLNMLRNDEITDIAIYGETVVGVLYSAVYDDEMTSSIVVHPKFEGKGIGKQLFERIGFDSSPNISKHVCEVVPPYTMEKFLKRIGYELEGMERDIKIYTKGVENDWY